MATSRPVDADQGRPLVAVQEVCRRPGTDIPIMGLEMIDGVGQPRSTAVPVKGDRLQDRAEAVLRPKGLGLQHVEPASILSGCGQIVLQQFERAALSPIQQRADVGDSAR